MPSFGTISIRKATTAALAAAMMLSILPAATMATGPAPGSQLPAAEQSVLKYMNKVRANQGLAPLRMAGRVRQVADQRSVSMRNQNYFGHVSPSGVNAANLLNRRGIGWINWGEAIGWTSGMTPEYGAKWMVDWWSHSPSHRKLMLSKSFNYAGIGIVKEGSKLLYTIVFVTQRDHTAPVASLVAQADVISVSSIRDVTVAWRGKDRRLATRTAGLQGFKVQYKKFGGDWRTVRKMTNKRQISMDLDSGKHKFRVRSVDNRGNKSPWKLLRVHAN
jgi:uncharacterized protein YkwD